MRIESGMIKKTMRTECKKEAGIDPYDLMCGILDYLQKHDNPGPDRAQNVKELIDKFWGEP